MDLRGGDRLSLGTAMPPDASVVVQWFVLIECDNEWWAPPRFWYLAYKSEINSHIEADFWQAGVSETTFEIDGIAYRIDFSAMTQHNLQTYTRRPVCRCLKMIPNSRTPTMDHPRGWTVIHQEVSG